MENLSNESSTKDKIIDATLDIISTEGFQNVKIRKIAGIADVNIASINYHFGSKDVVINEALKYVTMEMKQSFKCLKDQQLCPQKRLRNFFRHYVDIGLKYPDIIRNFVNQSMNEDTVRVEYEEYIKNEGAELIRSTLKEINLHEDPLTLNMRIFQILSSLSYPILLGDKVKQIIGIDYKDKEERYKYVELVLKNHIGNQYK